MSQDLKKNEDSLPGASLLSGEGAGTRAVAASSFHSAGPRVVSTCCVSGLAGEAVTFLQATVGGAGTIF